MKKGMNTAILEGRQSLTNLVNGMLSEIPAAAVAMMLENLYNELNKVVEEAAEKEKEEVLRQEEAESQQVVYDPEE